jgi:dihydrofolate reductase
MSKVILSIAVTLDGFIARENGSVDFLDPFNENEGDTNWFAKFLENISVIVMGNTTFQEYHKYPGFFDFYKGKDIYVFSRNPDLSHEKVTFINESPVEFLKNFKTEKDIWLLGGATINKSFLTSNLIDEYIIGMVPVIIGTGIPLFAESDHETQLKFVKSEKFKSGIVNLYYKKK